MFLKVAESIKCYQCSSDERRSSVKDDSYCGAWGKFDPGRHELVDCQSNKANTPGLFCLKETRESAGVWGPWKTVIRRCAEKSSQGVSGSCEQSITNTGIQIYTCSCNNDGCNAALPSITLKTSTIFILFIIFLLISFL
ncbi:unnamed protein product [Gordionus sp. m RMFG-2023]